MKEEAYGVRAVERAVRLLEALAEADGPQTLSELAARAELSVPTAFRLMRTLQQRGLVASQAPGSRYALGYRILELAHALLGQLDVVGIARPILNAARSRVNETTALAVQVGDHWVPIASAEATHSLRRVFDVGERTPLYADSTGKVFLAAMSDDELEAYLARTELLPFSETTVTNREQVIQKVAETRAAGAGISINERGFGGAAAAAPVLGHDGRLVAVLLIAAPANRFTGELQQECFQAVLEAAAEISRALGYRRSPTRGGGGGRRASLDGGRMTERAGTTESPGAADRIEHQQEVTP